MKKGLKEEILESQSLSRSERRKKEGKLQKNMVTKQLELSPVKLLLKEKVYLAGKDVNY